MNLRQWCHDHGLSLLFASFVLWSVVTYIVTYLLGLTAISDVLSSWTGDFLSALALILATKYLIEKGSSESKE